MPKNSNNGEETTNESPAEPTKALRFNTGKPKLALNLLHKGSLVGEALVWERGLKRYPMGNWTKGQSYIEAANSLSRHLADFLNGRDYDVDPKTGEVGDKYTGIAQVFCIICCAKILAVSWLDRPDLDDRPTPTTERNFRYKTNDEESYK